MRRVVVTGMGIVSPLGGSTQEVTASLREGRSGIVSAETYKTHGFRCQVHGAPTTDAAESVDRRAMRFHGGGTAWNHVAMDQAIRDAGLEPHEVSNERTGLVMGSGGPSTRTIVEAADITRDKGPKRIGPFAVPKAMSSTASATLSTFFEIKGLNYSISAACATTNICIGHAAEQIALGKQDVVFAGGCEELDWTLSALFDAMGAMSTHYNDRPAVASRAFDKNRDGFVIAGGAGVLVLEEAEHAKARGANIIAEIAGYASTSDGFDMVQPSGGGRDTVHASGAEECRRQDNRLHQPPRDLDTRGRCPGDGCHSRRLRGRRAADCGNEVPVGSQPWRGGGARGDILPPHDALGFHRAIGPHRRAGSGLRRLPHRPRASGQRDPRGGPVQRFRLRRHQRLPGDCPP